MAALPLSIFISYSRTNSHFVDRLEADLKAHSFYPWVDRSKLEGGQVWLDELERAIRRSQIVLVILSPEAVQSENVRMEYRYAQSQGKWVIPLDYQTTDVPIDLHSLQRVDFKQSYEKGLNDLLMTIDRMRSPAAMPPAVPIGTNGTATQNRKIATTHKNGRVVVAILLLLLVVSMGGGGFWLWIAHQGSSPSSRHQNLGISVPINAITPTTSRIPAQTPTSSPTPTTISALSPEARLALAKATPVIYSDPLTTQDAAQWDTGTQCTFTSNGYLTSTDAGKPAFCHELNKTYQDAFISVNMAIAGGGSAGMIFRDQFPYPGPSGGYFFEIDPVKGMYKISLATDTQPTLQNWTKSPAIHTGQGVKNTIQVIAQGNTLFFYSNGSFLQKIVDRTYTQGSISFICYTSSSSQTQATFSNLSVHTL